MSLHKYLTHKDKSYREFARYALSQPDWEKYKIIEEKVSRVEDLNEYTFYKEVHIHNQQLPKLPVNILYCTLLFCTNNKLEFLPKLPYCEELWCWYNNKLESLPSLPKCEILDCRNTNITDFSTVNPNCDIYK